MKRRLLNLVTAVSLLLFAATLLLWAFSVRGRRAVRLTAEPGRARFAACEGGVLYFAVQQADDPARGVPLLDVGSFGGGSIKGRVDKGDIHERHFLKP